MQLKSSYRKAALSVGCTAHIVQDGLTATVYVLLPILAQAFGFTYAQVGLFKSLKSLGQAVLEMCSGIVTERVGECRVIFFGLALSGVGYVTLAAAPGALLVMACLLIIGAGTAFQHAPSSALIISAYPATGRRGALGLYNASGDVGKLLFTGCFSLAIAAGLAWRGLSLFYGFVALAAAIAIVLGAPTLSTVRTDQAASDQAASDQNCGGKETRPIWGIRSWRAYGTLLSVVFIDTMVQAGVLVFLAFLMLSKGLPLALATGATAILITGGVFGKAVCGFLADRVGVCPAFGLVQGLTAAGLIAIVVAPNWLALVLLLPLGAVTQGSTSITYGLAADLIHPRRMARGYALLYSSASFSSAAGPLAFGLIADGFEIENAIFAMAVVALVSVPPIFFLPATLETDDRST